MKQLYLLELTVEEAETLTEAVLRGASQGRGRAEYAVLQRIIAALDNQRNAYHDGEGTTPAEAAGLAVARHFQWDWRVIDACIAALEDANFHDKAAFLLDKRRPVSK